MSKSARNTNRREDVIAWIILSICGILAFTGAAIGHKEITAFAFIGLGIALAAYAALTVAENSRMKARIRKASKRTAADMV